MLLRQYFVILIPLISFYSDIIVFPSLFLLKWRNPLDFIFSGLLLLNHLEEPLFYYPVFQFTVKILVFLWLFALFQHQNYLTVIAPLYPWVFIYLWVIVFLGLFSFFGYWEIVFLGLLFLLHLRESIFCYRLWLLTVKVLILTNLWVLNHLWEFLPMSLVYLLNCIAQVLIGLLMLFHLRVILFLRPVV